MVYFSAKILLEKIVITMTRRQSYNYPIIYFSISIFMQLLSVSESPSNT